jgi:hypothetical protein
MAHKRGDHIRSRQEWGASMIELCFAIPTLLLIAGATIDISRYMRFAQITAFVSQETASQIYRQCSDLTVYSKPFRNSSAVTIDVPLTRNAIALCIQRIQASSQLVLNQALGSSAINSSVFRWQIGQVNPAACTAPLPPDSVTRISVKGDIDPDLTELSGNGDIPVIDYNSETNAVPLRIDNQVSQPPLSASISNTIQTSSLQLGATGIVNQGQTTPLVPTQSICTRGRVVTVEIAYAFTPIVKFLPTALLNLDTTGRRRDISIL